MNSCQKLSELFSEYVERSLHEEVRQEVELHLKACPPCQETIERLGRLRRNLKSLSVVKVSPDFETVLRTRMRLERHRLRPWTFSMPLFPARAMAYGLLFVGVIGGGMFYLRYTSQNSPAAMQVSSTSIQQPSNTSPIPIQSSTYQRYFYALDGFTISKTPGAALRISSKGIERYQAMQSADSSATSELSSALEPVLISF
jgi:anti-sigma factor RsiW